MNRMLRMLLLGVVLAAVVPVAAAEEEPGKEVARGPSFAILEFLVEGNTILSVADVEKAVYPFLGPDRSIEDVEAAAESLQRIYQQRGYLTVLVGVPEQQVKDGVVTLEVTEGVVNRVKVSGARYYTAGRIRELTPSLVEGETPHFPSIQKDMAALNRPADRKVVPVLKPAAVPGQVDLELKVDDKRPLHGSLELNNRYTFGTEPLRLSGTVRYDNLWQRDHSISASFLTSPEDTSQVRVLSGTYVMPSFIEGHVMAFYGVRSNTDVAITANQIVGKGGILGSRYIIPLRAAGELTHSLTLAADYKDFTDTVGLQGQQGFTNPISYVPLGLQYAAQRRGARGTSSAQFSTVFGLRGAAGNRDEEFARRRVGAQSNFILFRVELQREQVLRWDARGVLRLIGQTSSQPLVPTEQFYAGGVDTVRGYLEAEALGDDALFARAELRSPPLQKHLGSGLQEVVALGFVEGGEVRVQQPLFPTQPRTRLSSFGVGLRGRAAERFVASMDLGVPLENTLRTRAYDPLLHFRLAAEF